MAAPAPPCPVCGQPAARYRCPRCSGPYCSVPCYRRHSPSCTNAFYEAAVQEGLAQAAVPPSLRDETVAMLQRERQWQREAEDANVQEEVAEAETAALEAAMARLAVLESAGAGGEAAVADVVAALPPDLRRRFQRSVATGAILEEVPSLRWTPWYQQCIPKVTELTDAGGEVGEAGAGPVPALPPAPPPLATLAAHVSPWLHCNVAEALYGYCFALHSFHGDWRADAGGFLDLLLSLSPSLAPPPGQGAGDDPSRPVPVVYHGLDEVCDRLAAAAPSAAAPGGFGLAVLADVGCLLAGGRAAVLRAVGDVGGAVEHRLKAPQATPATRKEKKTLQLVAHKLRFYLSWAMEQPAEAWAGWAVELTAAVDQQRSRLPAGPAPASLEGALRPVARRPHNAATAATPLVTELPVAPPH